MCRDSGSSSQGPGRVSRRPSHAQFRTSKSRRMRAQLCTRVVGASCAVSPAHLRQLVRPIDPIGARAATRGVQGGSAFVHGHRIRSPQVVCRCEEVRKNDPGRTRIQQNPTRSAVHSSWNSGSISRPIRRHADHMRPPVTVSGRDHHWGAPPPFSSITATVCGQRHDAQEARCSLVTVPSAAGSATNSTGAASR